jgi:hypothetical protein
MKVVVLPNDNGTFYYKVHVRYVIEFFKAAGYSIVLRDNLYTSKTSFLAVVNSKTFAVDFSDFQQISDPTDHTCLKFHCGPETISGTRQVIPFPPVSFYNWAEYRELLKEIKYRCTGDLVLNNQRPYAGALERRKYVQSLLKNTYGEKVDIAYSYSPSEYWHKINLCLVSVYVPGAREDILDRGQLQFLSDVFIGGDLNPNEHYIECRKDYSDLIEKIEWCKTNREACVQIGQRAKQLFTNRFMPSVLESILC